MNIYVVFVLLYVIFSIIGMANSSALKMFWTLGSLNESFMYFSLLYMPYPAISQGSSGSLDFSSVKDPSV
jgi:hypothetical protein